MPETPTSELLARYLLGEVSAAERTLVDRWSAANAANADELERLRVLTAPRGAGSWNVDQAWARVAERLEEPVALTRRRRVLTPALALAATLILALGATLAWRATRPASLAEAIAVTTAPGERRTLDLADGTSVTLAPGTRLTVAAGYGTNERRVDLSGEAWFEVVHDETRPFRVYAADALVEDLGTEFAVRAVPGSGIIRVAVVSGSASLGRVGASPGQIVTLLAADVGELRDAEAEPSVQRGAPLDPYVSWHSGHLSMDNEPLESVAAELERWYGIPFQVGDPAIGTRRFSGPLPLDRLDEVLEILGTALAIHAERRADTVRLLPRP